MLGDRDTSYSLICAVRGGRLESVRELIESFGLSYSQAWSDGYVLLLDALKFEHAEVAKLLLTNGSKVNSNNKNPTDTPHYFAVTNGDIEIVEMLLDRGANVNAQSKDGTTVLHLAVETVHEKTVKLLLEYGVNVDAEDKDGKTLLHFAVEKGHTLIVEHVLKHCPDLNNRSNRRALNVAVHGYGIGYSKIIENLLQYGFTVNPEDVNNCKLLHAAVEKGYLKMVEELLKYGTDVNMLYNATYGRGYMPLHVAAVNKQEEVAKLLISYGADVNTQDETGKTPIFYATQNADFRITKLLLTNKANIKDNPELLNIAVEKECREIVEVLLEHGADVNASD